ncbi:subtilisin family serine protease [Saccharothrix tamanrassetensis]|uniref:Subtilisin family serine protease n=1 Tax=Saccharothrix tamanrassetensis TaxID=1051531 RepID=A0A841CP15_9PSEU|nr:S8 family serine peptidase [Saccharothrix tamanrassetensis]MBB5957735.1 subtilisin family serine protease [Saccharothrix tamanrassetensis]
MPLLRRVQAVAVSAALLATGCFAASAHAATPGGEATAVPECIQPGPTLRYLVVLDIGTSEPLADAMISRACGTTTGYYPQIGVAVAVSGDPGFGRKIGLDRSYSAQADGLSKRNGAPSRTKDDETSSNRSYPTGTPDRTAEQWDMELIRAAEAHAISKGSRDVVVGVLDSGIDPTHPELVGALDPALSAGCTTGVANPSPTAWTPTTSAHGTHVAGTIAAADDGLGTTGVAPGVRIASVKVVDDAGFIYPEYAVCGFMWAAAQGMTITNNSYFIDPWVFTCQNKTGQAVVYEAVRRAVDYATGRGVLTVAAAGNSAADVTKPGQDAQSPTNAAPEDVKPRPVDNTCLVLPAQLRNVVAVSSVGADKVKAGYSSYGLGMVDVTAPGGDRKQPPAEGPACVLSTVPSGYDYSCGTSMATPHVSGVAALLASTHPKATAGELSRMLNSQAETLPCPADYDLNGTGVQDAYCTGYSEYNGFYGHGLVDAEAAVKGNRPVDATKGAPTSGDAEALPSGAGALLKER